MSTEGFSNANSTEDPNKDAKNNTLLKFCDDFKTNSALQDMDIKELNILSIKDQMTDSWQECYQNDAVEMDSSKCDKQEEHVSDNDSGFIIFVPTHSSSKKKKAG